VAPPQVHDAAQHPVTGAVGATVRPAGPIGHAGLAHLLVAGRPAFARGPGPVEVHGGPHDGPALIDDGTVEQPSPVRGQVA